MKQPIVVGNVSFKTQTECEKYTRNILNELGSTDSVKLKNEQSFNFLVSLCKRHPNCIEKLLHFNDYQIRCDALNKTAMALFIENTDGSLTEISWRICVTGKYKSIKTLFNSALRERIEPQILDYKNKTDLSYCRKCNCSLTIPHIDHDEPQFQQLVDDFVDLNIIQIPTEYNKKDVTFQPLFTTKDVWVGELFETYHFENATLRVLCQTCNLTRKKYKKAQHLVNKND